MTTPALESSTGSESEFNTLQELLNQTYEQPIPDALQAIDLGQWTNHYGTTTPLLLGVDQISQSTGSYPSTYQSLSTDAYAKKIPARYLRGHKGGVWRVFPVTKEKVISLSYDCTARIWDVWTMRCNAELKKHKKDVLSYAMTEKYIVTGDASGKMNLWDAFDFSYQETIQEENRSGFYSLLKIDDNTVASGACQKPAEYDGEWNYYIKLWDLKKKSHIDTFAGHRGGISSLIRIGDQCMVSASMDKTMRIWNTAEKLCTATIPAHSDNIYGMCLLDEAERVVTTSKDKTVKLWNLSTTQPVCEFRHGMHTAHEESVFDVCRVSNDVFATCSKDTYVKIWDQRTKNVIQAFYSDDGLVYSVCSLQKDKIIASTSGKSLNRGPHQGKVVIWDFRNHELH